MKSKNLSNKLNAIKNPVRGINSILNEKSYKSNVWNNKYFSHQVLMKTHEVARVNLHHLNYEEYFKFVDRTLAKKTRQNIIGHYFELGRGNFAPLDIKHEILWSIARIKSEKNKINIYLKYRNIIENAFWLNDVSRVIKKIDDLKSVVGHSIVTLELEIAFQQFFYGLESHKKLVKNIIFNKNSGMISYLTHFFSVRNEPDLLHEKFNDIIRKRQDNISDAGLKAYLEYKLLKSIDYSTLNMSSIMACEQSNSEIDVYETSLFVFQQIAKHESNEDLRNFIKEEINKIDGIDDWRLERVKDIFGVGKNNNIEFNSVDCSVIKPLIEGDVHLAVRKAYRSVRENGFNILNLKSGALSSVLIINELREQNDTRNPWRWLIKELANSYTLSDQYLISKSRIAQFGRNYHNLPSCATVYLDVMEKDIHPLDFHENSCLVSNINCQEKHIADINTLFDFIEVNLSEVESWKKHHIFEKVILAKKLYRAGQLENLIKTIENMINTEIPKNLLALFRCQLARLSVETNDYSKAIKNMSYARVKSGVNIGLLNIPLLTDHSRWPDLSPFTGYISLSIVLEMRAKTHGFLKLDTFRRFALEKFLDSQNVIRPSDLQANSDCYTVEELTYFLRYVCTDFTMAMCDKLKGSVVLDEERKAICALLGKIDRDNAAIYQAEIVTLLDKATIQEGVRLVDSSRVHVDADELINKLESEVAADLMRYRSLVKAGVSMARDLSDVIKEMVEKKINDASELNVESNEADRLLYEIYLRLKDSFLNDQYHGLDSYLSKRIRHNSLTGFLRGAFEEVNLVTFRDDGEGEYLSNNFWLNKLGDMEPDAAHKLDQILKSLSRSVDDVVVSLKEYFQVRSPEKKNGLFEIDLSGMAVFKILGALAQSNHDVKYFISGCFSIFWALLEKSFGGARELLLKTSKQKFSMLGQQFRLDVQEAFAETEIKALVAELNTAIGMALTEIQYRLGVCADWFNKREVVSISKAYTPQQILDVSIEAALMAHRGSELNIKKNFDVSDIQMQSASLFVISDIVWVAIDNVCLRSDIPKNANLDIHMSIDESKEIIKLEFISDVAPKVPERNMDKVQQIRKEIMEGSFKEGLKREGKSGLKKIAAIVLRPKNGGNIEFNFQGLKFHFKVEMPLIISEINEVPDEDIAC
jgi:hypothetical protein